MVRSSHRGVTSIISAMKLNPKLYHTLNHFFRSKAYTTEKIYDSWIKVVLKYAQIKRFGKRVLVLGDHSKVSKEGLHMPGVQILHQDSQNSGKSKYIAGHNYGHVSAVITNEKTSRSLPLMTELQESPPKTKDKKAKTGESLVTQMLNLVHKTAKTIGEPVVVALDAYFSVGTAWEAIGKTLTASGERLVEIVTRAKKNVVAYTVPEPPKVKKRGQPRKYGKKIVLRELFSDMSKFTQTTMNLYGKQTKVKYLCLDLIWKPAKQLVRFVLVETNRGRCIFMSSDLSLTPEEIITIYALRFKIEPSFAELKNDIGCFEYHFWTKAMPKRRKWKNAVMPDDHKLAKKVKDTKRAAEAFVCLSTIAAGILSIIAFHHSQEIWNRYSGWIKTIRSDIPSLAVTKDAFAQDFHDVLTNTEQFKDLDFIQSLIRQQDFLYLNIG